MAKKAKADAEPVPMWRVRLCTMLVHKAVAPAIKADIKAALDEIDHLRDVIKTLKD